MNAQSQIRKDCVRILGIEAEPRVHPVWNEIRKLEERYGSTAVVESFNRWANDQVVKLWKAFEEHLASLPNGEAAATALSSSKVERLSLALVH